MRSLVSIVARQLAQMLGTPFQQHRAVRLRLGEQHKNQRGADDYQGDPVGPGEADLGRVGTDYGTQNGSRIGGEGDQRQAEGELHGSPDVADRAARHCHRAGREHGTYEAEGESSTVIGRQGLGHDEQQYHNHGAEIDGIAAEGFGEGAREKRAYTGADKKDACDCSVGAHVC